jgi:hypothetical protein
MPQRHEDRVTALAQPGIVNDRIERVFLENRAERGS